MPTSIAVHDVVQLDPESHPRFAACFAIVDEVRSWGVVATVRVPGNPPGDAPIRLETGTFIRVGEAAYVPAPTDEDRG